MSASLVSGLLLALVSGQVDPTTSSASMAGLCAAAKQKAVQGDKEAQVVHGRCLLEGKDGDRDPVKARAILERAAAGGSADAAITLGKLYWNGDGVSKDNALAARWWRTALEAEHPEAPFLLGQEAFVRLVQTAKSPRDVKVSILREAISFLQKARRVDPSPIAQSQAARYEKQLHQFDTALRSEQ